ncbi:MAG TPA: SRPBCC family protein [Microthrixaceae bacterium]|nr:SRPBCC family protein [Microthrixaceae bacterium]
MPPPSFSERTRLDVPADYAFAFLADPSTAHVIDPAVTEYTPDSLPMQQGTRNVIRFRMWGIPLRVVSVVKEWQQGRRMVMENVKPSWPVRAIATHSFVSDGDACTCTYTWAMEFRSSGPLGAIIGHAFARFMHSNAEAQQRLFKEEVERRFQHEHRAGGPADT